MYAFSIGDVGDDSGILIGSTRVCAFSGDVRPAFAMLALVAGDHIDRLLQEVEVEVLVAEGGCEVKVAVYEGLGACIEERIDIGLVPTSLFDWLKLAVEIVEPLAHIPLVRL